MNEIIKAMEERRSIRRFKSELPKEEDIAQIVEAGLYAASGRGRQATLTIAVTNKALRDRISEANRKIGGWDEGFDPFYGAPVIVSLPFIRNHGFARNDTKGAVFRAFPAFSKAFLEMPKKETVNLSLKNAVLCLTFAFRD